VFYSLLNRRMMHLILFCEWTSPNFKLAAYNVSRTITWAAVGILLLWLIRAQAHSKFQSCTFRAILLCAVCDIYTHIYYTFVLRITLQFPAPLMWCGAVYHCLLRELLFAVCLKALRCSFTHSHILSFFFVVRLCFKGSVLLSWEASYWAQWNNFEILLKYFKPVFI